MRMTDQREDATYDAYLLHFPDGSWLAQLADLPGAYATGDSQADAMAQLTAAIPAYYAWLSQHDEYTPTTHSVAHVVARAVVEAPAGQGLGAFFADDAQPVSEEDLDWWLAALEWAYDDLQALAQRKAPSPRRDATLTAVAQAQALTVALATGVQLSATPGADAQADALGRLSAARGATLAAFRATTTEQRAAVREVDGQRWSLRRGLRESALLVRRTTDELAAQDQAPRGE
jgi:predicted RNase H-like HicB family nuclease